MPYVPFGPARDQSMQRARAQILKMLEQEDLAKQQRRGSINSSPDPGYQSGYDDGLPDQGVNGDQWAAPPSPDNGSDNEFNMGIHPAAVILKPSAAPFPVPWLLPPIAVPGTKENQEWVRWALKMLRDLG